VRGKVIEVSDIVENPIVTSLIHEEYDTKKKIKELNSLEARVRNMQGLKDIKKEREEREKANLQKNELKLLDKIIKGKSNHALYFSR
jgi:hypothetical protein